MVIWQPVPAEGPGDLPVYDLGKRGKGRSAVGGKGEPPRGGGGGDRHREVIFTPKDKLSLHRAWHRNNQKKEGSKDPILKETVDQNTRTTLPKRQRDHKEKLYGNEGLIRREKRETEGRKGNAAAIRGGSRAISHAKRGAESKGMPVPSNKKDALSSERHQDLVTKRKEMIIPSEAALVRKG